MIIERQRERESERDEEEECTFEIDEFGSTLPVSAIIIV